MIRRKFLCEENPEYGELGFRPAWLSDGEAYSGLGVAHDTLEHGLHDNGTVAAEFQAFGAMVFVRGLCDYWRERGNIRPPHEHIGSIQDIMERVHDGTQILEAAPTTQPLRNERAEQIIADSVFYALREAKEADSKYGLDYRFLTPEQAEHFRNWMRIGYRRACRRYAGLDPYDVQYCFGKIETGADKLLKHAEEGQELIVLCDPRHARVDMYCDYPPANDYLRS